jgi:hypothetical protein
MAITRSGPPTTHDSVTWRVPLSEPPSREWQVAFQAADESTPVVTAKGVQFESKALTFRSEDDHVPEWIEYIDKWIIRANAADAVLEEGRRGVATRAQQMSDARRERARESNEKFKNL